MAWAEHGHRVLVGGASLVKVSYMHAHSVKDPGQSYMKLDNKYLGNPGLWPLANRLQSQSLATNSPAPGPRPLTCGVSSECLGTRSYETTSRDQRGKIQMFFSSTGACTASKFPIANHHSQIDTQLYSASLIRLIWQQRHSDSEFDAL